MKLAGRDSLILYLYYQEGWSLRRIGKPMQLHPWQVRRELDRIHSLLIDSLPELDCDTYPVIEGLFRAWADAEQHQMPRIVALRQEQLAQALDQRMEMRATEMEALSECMGANCSPPHNRSKGAAWTHWEINYLNATGRTSVPSSAYFCRVCGRYAKD